MMTVEAHFELKNNFNRRVLSFEVLTQNSGRAPDCFSRYREYHSPRVEMDRSLLTNIQLKAVRQEEILFFHRRVSLLF